METISAQHITIQATNDGSHTLHSEQFNATYHSAHGALRESQHIYIHNGLKKTPHSPLKIIEFGFGTGLNALLTLKEKPQNQYIHYTTLEAFPVPIATIQQLNYGTLLGNTWEKELYTLHALDWKQPHQLTDTFIFEKKKVPGPNTIENAKLLLDATPNHYDLMYYDAFGPNAQPELWNTDMMQTLYNCLAPNGKFVTFCAQGQFKRNAKAVGFDITPLPGPPGKREMTLGIKSI